MILHFGVGPGRQLTVAQPIVDFGFPTLGEGGAAPEEEIVQRGSGRSRRQRREEEWRRRERKLAARSGKPLGRTPLPVEQAPRADDRKAPPAPVVVQLEAFALAAAMARPDDLAAQRRAEEDALLLLLADA